MWSVHLSSHIMYFHTLKKTTNMLNYEQVKHYFDYSPDTGLVTWTKNVHAKSNAMPGDKAGSIMPIGYYGTMVRVGGKKCNLYIHRIAWMLAYKEWPAAQVDHINGNKTDNRLSNLRDVPAGTNRKNQRKHKRNKSGHMGISWVESRKKWAARIGVDGKTINLGRFVNLDDAISARSEANIKYGFHQNHGRT